MKILILFIFFQSHQYDAKLAHQIDSMYVEDQRWRIEIMKIRKKEKSAYSEDTINEMWEKTDSLNELAAKEIVSRYGFPGYDRVGEKVSEHFWAIVQHCDNDVELQQKILLLMKNEIKKNNASKRNYAYLTDRVLVNKDQKQIYGTQCHLNSKTKKWEQLPLKDPAHINTLRKSVELESLADYLKSMN